jgi:Tol biopolymer transport system component
MRRAPAGIGSGFSRVALAGSLLLAAGLALLVTSGLVWAQQQAAPQALSRLTVQQGQDVRPVWSPDGSRVAFQSDTLGQYQIWTMRTDGSDSRRLSKNEADDRHPVWSPDGQRIAFDAGDEGVREIWVMNSDGTDRRQLTVLDGFSTFPSWSSDGKHIAFYLYRQGVMDLWVMDADGSAARAVTHGLADERKNNCTNSCHRPAWAPSGATLAFSGGDHRSIWTIDVASGDMNRITNGTEHSHFPWYLADGRLAYIVEYVEQGRAWTDVVVTDPAGGGGDQRLLSNISVQGPYEVSGDGRQVLFHSPRSGNFDIYLADTAAPGGMEALQAPRASAEIAPGVHVPTPAPATSSSSIVSTPRAGEAPQTAAPPSQASEPPTSVLQPVLIAWLALLAVGLLAVGGLQYALRVRRRKR